MSATKKTGAFLILVLFTLSTPGCLEDGETDGGTFCGDGTIWDSNTSKCIIDDNQEPLYDGISSYVTMEIAHAENIDDATLTYTIEIELYHDLAPNHTDNFRKHAQQGNYDNVTFHRIIDDFMIQGGDFERHDGTGGYAVQWYGYCNGEAMEQASDCSSETLYTLPDEANNNLTHVPCMLSMAKTSQPNTGGSQFFIMPDDITQHTWLDGVHTVFGKVISGCEHVTTLSEVATEGNDRPVVPVIIVSATASD